jgi:hypothetical protein
LQRVYPKPELLELSEYLIPNGAWLKLPSRFKKPFQFLFQFLHPTHLRAFRKPLPPGGATSAKLWCERAAALSDLATSNPTRVANRYHLKLSITFSPAIRGIADCGVSSVDCLPIARHVGEQVCILAEQDC